MSKAGLAMLFIRSGGDAPEHMVSLVDAHKTQSPLMEDLLVQVKDKWNSLADPDKDEQVSNMRWVEFAAPLTVFCVTKLGAFLDASSHLYMRVCPSVGMSVHPSVSI